MRQYTLTGTPVALHQMLDIRERRAYIQHYLIEQYHKPVVSFTMNIAGPVKNNRLIFCVYKIALDDLIWQLKRYQLPILFQKTFSEVTGNEAFIVVDCDPLSLKKYCCELESQHAAGRLYDIDIIKPDGQKVERQEIGLTSRPCLICGQEGKACASRRLHSVEELQAKTAQILHDSLMNRSSRIGAELACRSILYEVSTTPKPGLVDRANNGSHKDMDFYCFLNSSASLWPYFEECIRTGIDTYDLTPAETFSILRKAGMFAENRMLKVTGGVNTHKGAIFTLGVLCGSAGRVLERNWRCEEASAKAVISDILTECSSMVKDIIDNDFKNVTVQNASTFGQKLYALYGITGIRGQVADGLPAVSEHGLPMLEKFLASGASPDDAGAITLLALIAHTEDTNMIHRGSREIQKESADFARKLIQLICTEKIKSTNKLLEKIRQLDQDYIQQNLSPGGSADLLAVCWFLHFLSEELL